MKQQELLNGLRQQVEQERAVVRKQEAENWLQANRLQGDRSTIQHELSVVKRDKELISKREQELQLLEDQRRRNRFVERT